MWKISRNNRKVKKQVDVLDKGFVRLVDSMGNDDSIVQSARVSYGKGTKKTSEDEGLIRYLLRHAHTTPFEMVEFKFHIKAPIFVIRQWHRHRTWSYNEMSGRYSEMPEESYSPKYSDITKQSKSNKQGGTDILVKDAMTHEADFVVEQEGLYSAYNKRIDSGMRKELARINLPLAQYSEFYAKTDLHNLFHFLRLRLDSHAQYEIRVYAEAMYELIQPIVPVACKAFEDYRLNSMYLTSQDQAALKRIMEGLARKARQDEQPRELGDIVADLFPTTRERKEFFSKLEKIIDFSSLVKDSKN